MPSPRVEIHYCTRCRWLLRAGWTAQELLSSFGDTLGEVCLIPQKDGIFAIYVDGELVFDRKTNGRFPEMKETKQLVRNKVAPAMGLGHSDSAVKSQQKVPPTDSENKDVPVNINDHEDSCPNC